MPVQNKYQKERMKRRNEMIYELGKSGMLHKNIRLKVIEKYEDDITVQAISRIIIKMEKSHEQ